ncbi:hypothetical protein BDW42DRAFT_56195 [Aspergillus taichungensis]|uniref:Uncharacterized protein n=1 Tax=Aspergillus taichungensis TaxID=482145 RepID=A0A2J5IA16_9EURO|nr:hypothetical protein BDW42DRAFT_56195 [Aspergillus taichungensis]
MGMFVPKRRYWMHSFSAHCDENRNRNWESLILNREECWQKEISLGCNALQHSSGQNHDKQTLLRPFSTDPGRYTCHSSMMSERPLFPDGNMRVKCLRGSTVCGPVFIYSLLSNSGILPCLSSFSLVSFSLSLVFLIETL